MILSRTEIDRRVAGGSITISPYSPAQLNPTSYSYRLGLEIKRPTSGPPSSRPPS
jgi:deoxycytidine triphosphate deaminase